MGVAFSSMKMPGGRSLTDHIRERQRASIGNMGSRGGMAGVIGRAIDQARGSGPEAPRAPQPQPVQPRSEPSLGSVFSSKPDRAMYSGGRQMQKGWWP